MNHILIACYSTALDRDYDAVVLAVDDKLLQMLTAKRKAFDAHALTDENLHAHEYAGSPVHVLHLDEDDDHVYYLASPGEPALLEEHLADLELFGPWHLTAAANVYLKIVKEGFFTPGRTAGKSRAERNLRKRNVYARAVGNAEPLYKVEGSLTLPGKNVFY